MEVLLEGASAGPSQIILREGLFDYTTTLQFQLPYAAYFEECVLRIQDELPFVPVSTRQIGNGTFEYLCYPKGYVEFLQAVTAPVNVTGALPDLLDLLACCKYGVVSATQPQHWVLASMGGKTIMDKLATQVRYVNGGCPTAHFDIGGVLICQDILERCTDVSTGVFSGTLTESKSSMTSMNQVQGRIRYHYFDDHTYTTKEDVFLENSGAANMYKFVVSEDRKTQVETALQAEFWRRYVGMTSVTYTDVIASVLTPGQRVTLMGKEQDYICISVKTETNTNGAKVTAVLLPTIAPQQTLG